MTRVLANRISLSFRSQKSEKDLKWDLLIISERKYGRLGLAEPTDRLLSHSQAEGFQARIDFRFRRLVHSISRVAHEMITWRAISTLQCFLQLL